MLDIERRKIIFDLNQLFDNYSYLSELAEFCDNDYQTMIKMISKIIKYSFCHNVTDKLGYLKTPLRVDDDYKYFLMQNKKRFGLFKKHINLNSVYSLDPDIRISDLEGLVLPSINRMIDVCEVNKLNEEERKSKEEKQCLKYKKAMGFEDTAFWYSTTDLITFNSDFMYYHSNLSGDLEVDFYNLYNDERYRNNPNSPLYNLFSDNLEHIRKVNDIDLTRIGNLYVIGNGRHRILYLMYYDCEYGVPVSVTKRIEDEEFNLILLRLKDKYKINIQKNNIFNEDSNILINYLDKTYNIKSLDELKIFEFKLNNSESLDEFFVSDYLIQKKGTGEKSFSYIRDKMLVFWLNFKDFDVLKGNYTDYLKVSGETNSNVLYEAFNVSQKIYQKYNLLGIDYEEHVLFRLIDSTDEKDDVIKKIYEEAEQEELRGKVYEKKA